jgi:hypothetical protein
MSVCKKTANDDRENWTYTTHFVSKYVNEKIELLTWVAMYAMEAGVTWVIPWMQALPDWVALGSFSTELGDVKICLYPQ